MRVFITKTIAFTTVVLSIFMMISYSYKPHVDIKNDYMAAMIDKHNRLKEIKEHRMILVGGSNLAFGIDSEEMEKELNVNVINLGLHGGLGLEFILNEVMNEIKAGDIIILSIEYSLFDPKDRASVELVEHTQQIFPGAKAYYTFNLKERGFISYMHFKKSFETFKDDSNSIYKRNSFNKYGDFIAHLGKREKAISSEGKLNALKFIYYSGKFRELHSKCKSVGAKLFYTFPNYARSEYELNKTNIKHLESLIRKQLDFIPIINKPETFVYDDDYFYDTCYHLNEKGRKKRTDTLIEIIKENLPDLKQK